MVNQLLSQTFQTGEKIIKAFSIVVTEKPGLLDNHYLNALRCMCRLGHLI